MSKDNFDLFLDILDECGWSYFNYNKVHGKDKLGRNRTGERFLLDKKNLNACDNSVLIEKLKNTFNDVVDAYDKARPTYPQELLDDVMKFAAINFFEKGLEVGAGTGQATDLFLSRIEELDIVEVGAKQVEFLNKKYNQKYISVHKAYFEDYSSKERYDLE